MTSLGSQSGVGIYTATPLNVGARAKRSESGVVNDPLSFLSLVQYYCFSEV